jgi:hypothetical protein
VNSLDEVLMTTLRLGKALAAALVVAGVACSDSTESTAPATPTGLTVQQLSLTSVRVAWNDVTGAETYTLERASADNPGVYTELADTITGTQYDDTGLTEGVTYSYRVAAVAGELASAFSSPVSVATGVAAAVLSGDISASRTLAADTVYTLSGYVKVKNGATLTVQAGTKIVGDTSVPGSSLWITRGAKLVAIGTADKPIVFTSARSPGNRKPGDWGGIIIIGNGIINRSTTPILTEGPANVAEDYSGGTDNADSSGALRYVRIEFAGYDVSNGAGQELNSLSLYAVGSRTRIEYIQSMSGLDDSFEFWGGAVQAKYLVSYEAGDDHFDWSEGFAGHLQYLIAFQSQQLQPAAGTGVVSSDPRGFEADGCDPGVAGCTLSATGASTPYSNPTIANFTLVGTGNLGGYPGDGNGMVLRRGTGGFLFNGIVSRYKGIGCQMRDAWTDSLRLRDTLELSNVIFAENQGGNYDTDASRYCQESKWASNNHRTAGAAADLLLSLNPASLDFSPKAAADTVTVTIALPAARLGGYLDNTTFVGASDGTKWWQGWSAYNIN